MSTVCIRNVGHVSDFYCDDHDSVMQDAVKFHIFFECDGGGSPGGVRIDRGSRDPDEAECRQLRYESPKRSFCATAAGDNFSPSFLSDPHHGHNQDGDEERHPCAVPYLRQIPSKERPLN